VTAYVAKGVVTPISTATNTAGAAISLGQSGGPAYVAVTPNGATVYGVVTRGSGAGEVIPISTATDTAGSAIVVGLYPDGIAFTP
jgi:DNA-binding beta-propeller fold protein YncE